MKRQISHRCGKGTCTHYCSESDSKCSIFPDRRLCALSMKQRKKAAAHSKRQQLIWPQTITGCYQ